jgi:hypothetical protein
MLLILNGLECILVKKYIFCILINKILYSIELLQKLRLFVKAKQVTKHCIEKEKIPLSYDDPSEYDGALILSAQSPTLKRLPSCSSSSSASSSTNKNLPPPPKDFMCSIWFV